MPNPLLLLLTSTIHLSGDKMLGTRRQYEPSKSSAFSWTCVLNKEQRYDNFASRFVGII